MSSQATTSQDPSARSQTFVPVEGNQETTSAEAMLVAAYVVMWALLILFVGLGWRRQGRVEQRLGELEKAVGATAGPEPRRTP
ncbi:MAG TPA: CcmD family protein [Polyangiaceae bacterium]